jgi:hypothetical protein
MTSKLFHENSFLKLVCFLLPIWVVLTGVISAQATSDVPSTGLAEVKDEKKPTSDEEDNEDDDDC